jgi:hypothetical protein
MDTGFTEYIDYENPVVHSITDVPNELTACRVAKSALQRMARSHSYDAKNPFGEHFCFYKSTSSTSGAHVHVSVVDSGYDTFNPVWEYRPVSHVFPSLVTATSHTDVFRSDCALWFEHVQTTFQTKKFKMSAVLDSRRRVFENMAAAGILTGEFEEAYYRVIDRVSLACQERTLQKRPDEAPVRVLWDAFGLAPNYNKEWTAAFSTWKEEIQHTVIEIPRTNADRYAMFAAIARNKESMGISIEEWGHK